jgi:hypothetical protein
MTLSQYVKSRKKELDDFEKYWKAQRKIDKDNWPINVPEGEWYEQELAYNEGENA